MAELLATTTTTVNFGEAPIGGNGPWNEYQLGRNTTNNKFMFVSENSGHSYSYYEGYYQTRYFIDDGFAGPPGVNEPGPDGQKAWQYTGINNTPFQSPFYLALNPFALSVSDYDKYLINQPLINNGLYYTEGSGRYLQVGDEYMKIVNFESVFGSDVGSEAPPIVIHVERGSLGSTASTHGEGEIVKLWYFPPTPNAELPEDEVLQEEVVVEDKVFEVTKRILSGKPNYDSISQYNFLSDSLDIEITYENSTSLPKSFDKFVRKDLNTSVVGDEFNESILKQNLKFEGESFFRIDKMVVSNAGVHNKIKNCYVAAYLFSDQSFSIKNSNGNLKSYNQLWAGITSGAKQFFGKAYGNKKSGRSIGDVDDLGDLNLLKNLSIQSDPIEIEEYDGSKPFDTGSLELNDVSGDTPTMKVFNSLDVLNPIYIAVWMRGDAKKWHGTDHRKKRIQIFQINNTELYDEDGSGAIKTFEFDYENSVQKTGAGGGGGREAAAFLVSNLSVTINTTNGGQNTTINNGEYSQIIPDILTPLPFFPDETIPTSFLNIGPDRQLWNYESNDDIYNLTFADFFPITTIGTVDPIGEFSSKGNFVDLQNYYEGENSLIALKASAPTTVGIDLKMVRTVGDNVLTEGSINPTLFSSPAAPENADESQEWFYYVVSWDDEKNQYETVQDVISLKPSNHIELLNLQDENLYKLKRQTQNFNEIQLFGNRLKHTYNTPGIKTIKFIVFNTYDNRFSTTTDGDGNDVYNVDLPLGRQVGRWKLATARFYLDIPLSQYPDFSDVGGSDYTTIPWPYTTPVIGGTSQDSIYYKSIKNTLSSGIVGDVDIIDERFLINAAENNELGNSILNLDFEQVRFFNKSYGINNLLNLVYNEEELISIQFITDDYILQTLPFYNGTGMLIEELAISNTTIEDGYTFFHPPQYFVDNPEVFPQFFEEFDAVGLDYIPPYNSETNTNPDGLIDAFEIVYWSNNGRFDIADEIEKIMVGDVNQPPNAATILLSDADIVDWNNNGRPDISQYVESIITGTAPVPEANESNQEGSVFGDQGDGEGAGDIEGNEEWGEFYEEGGTPGGTGGDIVGDPPPQQNNYIEILTFIDAYSENQTLIAGNTYTLGYYANIPVPPDGTGLLKLSLYCFDNTFPMEDDGTYNHHIRDIGTYQINEIQMNDIITQNIEFPTDELWYGDFPPTGIRSDYLIKAEYYDDGGEVIYDFGPNVSGQIGFTIAENVSFVPVSDDQDEIEYDYMWEGAELILDKFDLTGGTIFQGGNKVNITVSKNFNSTSLLGWKIELFRKINDNGDWIEGTYTPEVEGGMGGTWDPPSGNIDNKLDMSRAQKIMTVLDNITEAMFYNNSDNSLVYQFFSYEWQIPESVGDFGGEKPLEFNKNDYFLRIRQMNGKSHAYSGTPTSIRYWSNHSGGPDVGYENNNPFGTANNNNFKSTYYNINTFTIIAPGRPYSLSYFRNPYQFLIEGELPNVYNKLNDDDEPFWDGETNSFSEESSVGQIFISDNSDNDLKADCKLELNTGDLTGKSILDSTGNLKLGIVIGDYRVKKTQKGQPMRRDSFIKLPKKNSNKDGAL